MAQSDLHSVPRSFVTLTEHLPATLLLAAIFWWLEQNLSLVCATLVFGWLLDIDHLFDYLLWTCKQGQAISISDFLSGKQFMASQSVYIPLHSWELAGAFFLFWYSQDAANLIPLCCGVALTVHLIQDQLSHRPHILGYFLCFRTLTKYDLARFCGK